MFAKRVVPLLALLAAPGIAPASAAADDFCRNGLFPKEPPFALARITDERAFFHDDIDGCPQAGDCRSRSYVIEDDVVLTGRTSGGFTCAFYPGANGGTAGWIETERLALIEHESNPALARWIGTWSVGDNPEVRFRVEGSVLHVAGEAFWPGHPDTTDWISIHVGEIAGAVSRNGLVGRYEDDNLCEIDFTLIGDYLVAGDNGNCGGANVSFSGVYRKQDG